MSTDINIDNAITYCEVNNPSLFNLLINMCVARNIDCQKELPTDWSGLQYFGVINFDEAIVNSTVRKKVKTAGLVVITPKEAEITFGKKKSLDDFMKYVETTFKKDDYLLNILKKDESNKIK